MAMMTSTPKQHSVVLQQDLMRLGQDSNHYVSITTFNEKVYVHIRVFLPSKTEEGKMIPMLTGVVLTVNQWRTLMAYAGMIDNQWTTLKGRSGDENVPDRIAPFAPIRLTDDADHFISVSLWKGVVKLHIRKFSKSPTTNKMIPTVKGITLSEQEWSVLKALSFNIEWNITEAETKLNNAKTLQYFDKWNGAASAASAATLDPARKVVIKAEDAEPPRKVIIKSEEPSTPPPSGNPPITPNGLPLNWAPMKKPIKKRLLFGGIEENAESEVDKFLKKFRVELGEVDEVSSHSAAVDEQSAEERMANCEGCQMQCGNQEAHFDGCLKSVIDKDDGYRIFH